MTIRGALSQLSIAGFVLAAVLCVRGASGQTTAISAADNQFFEAKVRPLLFDRCFSCHGEKLQRGGIRLDSHADVLKDASSLKVVSPGNPEASALVRAIRYDGKIQMPPGGKLTQDAIDVLTDWVKRGAPWPNAAPTAGYTITPAQRQFWAFQPIRKPAVPKVNPTAWVRNPIDAFILAGLQAKGLKPAAPADRRTLIRRATYDLTGLPPTTQEVTAFLADRSPSSFARVIDRLLASPRYGERWGRHWLDVARYADSADARGLGSEGDISEAWRYRDWVVNAFNSDMGFDKFVMNQLAGDLLPAESGQKSDLNVPGTIATGLLAIGNWGNGDADKEKLVTDIADDQVDIVSRGIMGVTIACARCHDHKFDPFPTKDYYGLAGIFFSSHILPRLTPKGQGEVMLRIPLDTAESKAKRALYEASLADATKQLQARRDAAFTNYAISMQSQTAAYLVAAVDFHNRPADRATQSLGAFAAERKLYPGFLQRWASAINGGEYPLMSVAAKDAAGISGVYTWRGKPDCPNMLVNTNPSPITISTLTVPGRSVAVHPGPSNGVAVEWVSPIRGSVQITGRVADADPNGGDGIAWAIDRQTGLGAAEVASGDFPNGGAQDFAQGKNAAALGSVSVSPGDRLQLVVLPKADYTCDTTVVQWVIKQQNGPAVWDLTQEMMESPIRSNPRADKYGHMDVWRFADMADIHREQRLPGSAGELLAKFTRTAAAATSRADLESAAQAFQSNYNPADPKSPFRPTVDELAQLPAVARAEIAAAQSQLDIIAKTAPPPAGIANGIQEGGIPDCPTSGIHDVHVHIRGRYDRLGDLVPRHFPLIMGGDKQPPITAGSGRLQLARWLVSDTHPLTARVIVNRIWQHHFGEGIVRTPSNFGLLGERPSHPELLDWLAANFKLPAHNSSQNSSAPDYACGWSMKRLHRIIMLSSAYQQSSQGDPAAVKSDPDNRLFGRYNRQRMEAESIRDTLLAVSGNLDTTTAAVGGVATRDFNAPRRTLYVMTVRSDRSGYAPLFDTADPTSSVDRRVVSTVAPQALFLMNNPFVGLQAKALAKRAMSEGGKSDGEKIGWLYALLYSRPPVAAELRVGEAYLDRTRNAMLRTAVAGPAPDRESRAWEDYCRILLCSNELVFID